MRPTSVKAALKTCITIKHPVFLWAAPGVGKSSVVHQTCLEMNLEMKDVRLPLLDAVDIHGLPCVDQDGRARWAVPNFLPQKGQGVLFLDELPQAAPMVQSAASQLILDRKIGDYVLPEGWAVVAAGNRETDKAATYALPSHIRNRFTHIDFEVHNPDWEKWAQGADVHTDIIAFIHHFPQMLHKFDKEDRNDRSFATPRSWEFASKILKAQPSADVEFDLLSGTIGKGPSIEFNNFLKVRRQLPSIEAILAKPETAKLPERADMQYAISAALARIMDNKNAAPALKYLYRLPVEYVVMATKTATERDPALLEAKAMLEAYDRYYDDIFPDEADKAGAKKAKK